MRRLFFLFFFSMIFMGNYLWAQDKQRLNNGWEFVQQDLGGIWEAVRPVSIGSPEASPIWGKITLPHSFNQSDAVNPSVNYYQGPGWYRNYLTLDNPHELGRIILHFEGAGQKSEVYVYQEKVGEHVGGYDEWYVDITDAVERFKKMDVAEKEFKGKVPIVIRVDNTRDLELIPSDLSDFNVYGGLYRYVNLIYVPELSIKHLFADVSVNNKGNEGRISLRTRLWNPNKVSVGKIEAVLKDYSGKVVSQFAQNLKSLDLGGDVELNAVTLKKPILWSTANPNLYTLTVSVISGKDTATVVEKIGFRSYEFVNNGPFKLNGQRLLLRGTHRHEDHAGVGPAMTEQQIWKEMRMMKTMGVNFIRLGHYQQSRIVLDACDELGILVWEEIPWCRGGLGGDVYKEQARRMLTNMIEQHYNRPSVIIWGLGNENDWPGDFDVFDQQEIRAFMTELHHLSHRLDNSRKTAIRRCDFCRDIVDVYSPSIWAGWYRGIYTDYKTASEHEFGRVNHFLHVEWGGDSHARRHSETPDQGLSDIMQSTTADERGGDASLFGGPARVSKDGDWSESYIINLIDWHLKEQETMPWLTGTAYWPFKDFSTPIRPENPVPYVNQKGVVERNLNKKESFYVFQSYWTEEPMIHIYGHNWPIRWGEMGQQRMVKVFSNCDEAELFLNGVSLGIRKRESQDFPAAGLRWMVNFENGENTLNVIGRKGDVLVKDTLVQVYQTEKWDKPVRVTLRVLEEKKDTVLLEAYLLDKEGVKCLDARDYINFDVAGEGYLIVDQGTSDGSSRLQAYNGRATVRLVRTGSNVVAIAKADDLNTVVLDLSRQNMRTQVRERLKDQVLADAEMALFEPVLTVTSSICSRSVGGPHDFYSEGDYWWPNPADKEGPYVRKDGWSNPDNFVDHRNLLMRFGDIVGTLISAWRLTDDEQYVNAALNHFKGWFIDEDTKMNPSLTYAQAIQGIATGRGIGIIDGIHFVEVVQALHVLKEAGKLPPSVLSATEDWFSAYLLWLNTHPYGLEERDAKNNHGTCWLMQVAAYARYVENDDVLNMCIDRYRHVLLPHQMAQDGSFPLELERTKPYGYALFNLDAFATICFLLKDKEPLIPSFQIDHKSLRQGITFMIPFIKSKCTWPYGEDVMYWNNWPKAQSLLLFGALLFDQQEWMDIWKSLSLDYTVEEVKRNSPIRYPLLWI